MKGITLFIIAFLCSSSVGWTQESFSLTAANVSEVTLGTTDPESGSDPANWDFVQLSSDVINTSDTSTFPYLWKLISKDIPEGWALVGFCDNIVCWPAALSGGWANFAQMTSAPLAPGDTGILHLRIAAPVSAANGTAVVVIAVSTNDQTDTVTYTLTKNATGISVINAKDARVNIYPNPAANYINVFADKSLQPKSISVFNILGRQLSTQDIKPNTLTTMLDINALSSGMYMLRIMDENGKVITSRKFTKQ